MTTTDTTDTTDTDATGTPGAGDGAPAGPAAPRGPFGTVAAPDAPVPDARDTTDPDAPVVVDLTGADPGDPTDPDDAMVVDLEDDLDVFDDVVDPRLRARWIDARRAEGRRRLYVVCGIAGVVALGVIAFVVAHSSLLGAGSIDVEGSAHTPAPLVRVAARIPDGEPLLFLDEGAVARRVEALPMVAHAEVSTELPSTVVITVTERVPVAWMRAAAAPTVAVLDHDGRVLERVDTAPAGLTRVRGLGPVGAPGTRVDRPDVVQALARVPDLLRVGASRFDVRDDDGPVLVLGGSDPVVGEVRYGSLRQMRAKSEAALAVMAALTTDGEQREFVDVQVPNAPFTR